MIYFDNASTTKTLDVVNHVMLDVQKNNYFNPSSLHTQGFMVSKAIERARKNMLSLLHGSNYQMVFVGSATEANNLALFQARRGKILVGAGEHPSVLAVAKDLLQKGRDVEFVPLCGNGQVDAEAFEKLLTKDVSFVSIQMVSNETGAINDIPQLVKMLKQKCPNAIFHSDMVQALGKININLASSGVDMATFSAHKIHGPKGTGALVAKSNIKLVPQILGGGQEKGLRSGTENVAQILGFAKALEFCVVDQKRAYEVAKWAREQLIQGFEANALKFHVHGNGSPFVLSVSFDGVRGESLMHALEQDDILIATGSACSSKKVGNTTLEAMKVLKDEILGNVRISFGHDPIDKEQIECVLAAIAKNVRKLKE